MEEKVTSRQPRGRLPLHGLHIRDGFGDQGCIYFPKQTEPVPWEDMDEPNKDACSDFFRMLQYGCYLILFLQQYFTNNIPKNIYLKNPRIPTHKYDREQIP